MTKLTVNGIEIQVQDNTTVLQACEAVGVEIPRFCYHEKLAIAGNCRMCLVEIEKSPKPVASCAHPVAEGMVVHTNTELVKRAREGVMEFLLANHPLDCPICDQGGECDLQDQAMKYGKGYSRFDENKRSVDKKYMGPLISTNMTRCIHCTRCVRFLDDIAGTAELGAIGRGEDMEITTYIGQSLSSELSANIIDLCPVGALTAKPYEFQFRAWELKKTISIDVLDAVGSNIIIGSRGTEVMRILPNHNDEINEEWISDKARFAFDGLKYQRLDVPMIKKGNKLVMCDWEEAFENIQKNIVQTKPDKIGAVAGDFTDVETMFMAKKLFKELGVKAYDCRQNGSNISNTDRWFYRFGTTINKLEDSDVVLIIGSNPRHEAPIINAWIRKAHIHNQAKIYVIGEEVDLTYEYEYLGANPDVIKKIASCDHELSEIMKSAKCPTVIVGDAVFCRDDHEAFSYYLRKMCVDLGVVKDKWNGFNVLHTAASRVGGLDIGFVPEIDNLTVNDIIRTSEVLFLFGADEIDFDAIPKDVFVIYQGHHGDNGARRADIVLPGVAYTEKDATFVNTEGRVQRTYAAVPPIGYAKQDWELINELAKFLDINLGCDSLTEIRKQMVKACSALDDLDTVLEEEIKIIHVKEKPFAKQELKNPITNFYINDPISRNSKTMALCSKEILKI